MILKVKFLFVIYELFDKKNISFKGPFRTLFEQKMREIMHNL